MFRCAAQQPRPRLGGLHHRVVDADREQDDPLALALLVQAPRHLALDPVARDRALGQYQQHLVPQPDRLVDGVEDLGADRHVVRREPAAHALVLEVGVEPLGNSSSRDE